MYIGRAPQTSQGNVDAVRSYTNRSELEYAFHVGYPVWMAMFLALNLVNILAGVLVALRFLDNLFSGAF